MGRRGLPVGRKEAGLPQADQGAAQFGLKHDDEGERGQDQQAGIEEFHPRQLFAAQQNHDVGDEEKQRSALDEPGSAGAAQKFHNQVDNDPDEEQLQEDDPDGVLPNAIEIIDGKFRHH